MKIWKYLLALVIMLAFGVLAVLFVLPVPERQIDVTVVNDIAATLADDFEQLDSHGYALPHADALDYAVIDGQGNLRASTRSGLSEDIHAALRHGDLIVDIARDGRVMGKVIIWNDAQQQWEAYQGRVQMFMICVLLLLTGACAVFLFDLRKKILLPFEQMRGFAQRIAAGELDIPLEMDRRNAFGAFTESFDLMRDELHSAREKERAAERSKRELVASLSHDIQTPVSSIQAVAELMEVTADDAGRQKLQTIQQKSNQIHRLVTDLFHATLEELNTLKVTPVAFPSDQLRTLVEKADYRHKAHVSDVPGCLVMADPVRLAQVMDNIIANSYKYADTGIDVSAGLDDRGLTLVFRDFGPGVEPDELPLVQGKYFRGSAAEGKVGYGLGLHISNNLMERMGGRLFCSNADPGFAVMLWLRFDSDAND